MSIGVISNIYLIIFLPLISSLTCCLFFRRNFSFWIAIFSLIFLLLLEFKAFFNVLIYEKITSDFELSVLSLALEFKLDLLGAIFLIIVTFLKIIILFYYRPDIEELLNDKNRRIFYSVYLLHIFGLIGIFTTNNIFNLFLFFEIYTFSFFAILSIARDYHLLKLAFHYFCINVSSSLVILFAFFAVYLAFGESRFDLIANSLNLVSNDFLWFLVVIFFALTAAFIIKFFPFWLYFKKLKSTNLIANFLAIETLFIKTTVGIFLTLKFIHFFFGNSILFGDFAKLHIELKPILILLSLLLIFYSSYKLYQQKHLKIISAYICLNNLGFIFIAISLQTLESLQSIFFYLLNFSLVSLFIFIFGSFLKRYFSTSSINKIWLIRRQNLALVLPIKMLIFFIAGFPLTILFFANWHLAYASFKFGFEAFVLSAIIVSYFTHVGLSTKIISAFFAKPNQEEIEIEFEKNDYRFYLMSFWLLIIVIYSLALLSGPMNDISLRFASLLLSSSI